MMSRCTRWVFAFPILTAATCLAQSPEPHDAWLMRNYRFAPPPAPQVEPVNPVIAQLQEIQNTTLNILRKANFAGDFEAALAAAAQATATAQVIGNLTGQLKPPQQTRPTATGQPKPEAPLYLVAEKDGTIQAATAVWTDGLMLHYMTLEGGHEQVRLDRVDWKLSTGLNRRPEPGGR
jgi:hypothetical protein